ncbi:hypothetical protein MSAN_01431200 [Mycena sanguinolenta]|uniref:Uncharacterized protein n=1 Tax=Mycena sanguinolenta TaxID=230812 RepID=A0A8H6Y6H6_9AGAR|nr:hypothetical protein MSAN_01431200 [Mycena sanguinolenta]
MAPIPRTRRRRVLQKVDANNDSERRREMSAQERVWWSGPYLRMLASPMRQCYLTERYLPADFLIRLAAMRVPLHPQNKRKNATQILFPDGLQHPKFKMRRSGRGIYIMCWREGLHILNRPMRFKRLGAAPPPRLGEYITHLLRLRILQELYLLAKHLEALYRTRSGPTAPRPSILRRLTRAEWGQLRTTGALPYPGAIAVLIVPPVNRDPTTRQRPSAAGAMSDRPPAADGASSPRTPPKRATPPLSILHPTHVRDRRPLTTISEMKPLSDAEFWEKTRQKRAATTETPDTASTIFGSPTSEDSSLGKTDEQGQGEVGVPPHAEEKVPLYNSVALFPGRVQRARLHTLLTRILGVESRWRFSATAGVAKEDGKVQAAMGKGDNKGSHAFLICPSDEVDVAALGIALWRLRMWEGGGVEETVPVRSGGGSRREVAMGGGNSLVKFTA